SPVERLRPLDLRAGRELPLDELASRPPHGAGALRVRGDRAQRVGEARRVARLHEKSRLPVADELRVALEVGADDGCPDGGRTAPPSTPGWKRSVSVPE